MKTPYMCLKCGNVFPTPQEMKNCNHIKEEPPKEETPKKVTKTKGA